nr:amidohydrolase family protein [Kouleothrix sp.]
MQADTILSGGVIHTMDPARPRASALALAGATILEVGDDAAVERLAGAHTRRIDLAGRALVPGFNDAHIHLWKEGMLLSQVNARPAHAPTIAALVEAFAERAAAVPAG